VKLELKTTTIFSKSKEALYNDKIRFIIEQGGSRSSKTYSICQLLIVYALTTENKIVSIVRKSFPSLRGSVMRDFFEIMKDLDIYSESKHNKSENLYTFDTGTIIEFFSIDDEQKLRGRKRDILWINEANEINFEEYTQLNLRTTEKLIFDFNPSDNFHWLYDLISREESILIVSTYKDNPFLTKSQITEIENLINVDESYYRIYALGEKGTGKTTIYTHYKMYEEEPEFKEVIYGLDFGYNHPTSLVQCQFLDNKIWVKELIYRSGLTTTDLINEMKSLNLNLRKEIICDSARPEIIEELKRNGFMAKGAIKEVKAGIDTVKSSELYIQKGSLNLLKELSSYKWKTNGDIVLDEPVKVFDDAVDALRYAAHWWKIKNKNNGIDYLRFY
jgi:phage terminase large subunit